MLLVHGFLSCNAQWDLNRDALGHRHRLIMVELMGHGASGAPRDVEAYAPANVVAELERIRTDLAIARWWVCGQSLGGAVAMRYCLTHQDAVLGLVFTNSRAVFGIERRGVAADAPPISDARDLPIHPNNATRLPGPLKAKLVAAADAMPLHAVRNVIAHRTRWESIDQLGRLHVPVLLVNGRWEKAFQPFVQVAQDNISDLTLVNLEGGHAINVEQADGFNAALLSFTRNPG
jgi:pimeloyl-ACP methyl ester carboxylesterase